MKTTDKTAATPVSECLATATAAATDALGTAENRSVTASTNLSVAVTEAGVTKTNKANASVTVGVESSEAPVAS
jgi:hypothetical protein